MLAQVGKTPEEIDKIVVTGYGRMNFEYSTEQLSELSCHAKGVNFLLPRVRTIVDIGGQDVKVLRIGPAGQLLNFQMNDKCAAGTGRFLDVMAKVLDVDINDMGPLSECADAPVSISNTCTVFAESEVISHMSAKVGIENIAAGIHNSVAKRVAGMALRVGKEPDVAMSGGVALNIGVVQPWRERWKRPFLCIPTASWQEPIGAALVAWEKLGKNEKGG